jgi:uncharacterized membrane protein YfcA
VPWELVFIFVVVLIGSFIQGSSGFGFGLFSMGLLPIIFSLKDSTLLVLSLTLITSLSILIKIWRYIEIKGLVFILSAAITGRVFSFMFLTWYGEMDFMKKGLGFFLVAMVLYLLFKKKQSNPSFVMKPAFPIGLGFVGGFVGGVFAVGGPFFVFYYLMLYEDKHRYNANLQTTFVITSIFTLILHGFHGDFNSAFYMYFLLGATSVFVGVTLGMKWFERLPRDQIQKFASFIVLLAGLNLIIFS